jgi:hypothetical protein
MVQRSVKDSLLFRRLRIKPMIGMMKADSAAMEVWSPNYDALS